MLTPTHSQSGQSRRSAGLPGRIKDPDPRHRRDRIRDQTDMPRPKSEIPTFSLTKRGAAYYVQWWQNGRARRLSARTTDKSAAGRFLAQIRAGYQVEARPECPTIRDIVNAYERDRSADVASNTLKFVCDMLRRHDALADLPANMLGKAQVRAYLTARRKEGRGGASAKFSKARKPLSDGTLIRELTTLRAALNWAEREGWIDRVPHIEMPPRPAARERWLTGVEARLLLSCCEADHMRMFVTLALHTAARAGAILSLRWDQVDLERRRIDFGAGNGRKRRAKVPIDDILFQALTEQNEIRTCETVVEYRGEPVASVKTGFRAAAKRAHLSDVTPITLRHTAATWMMQAGMSPTLVAAFLGNTAEMVEKVYGHHHPDYLKEAGKIVAERVSSYSGRENAYSEKRIMPVKYGAAGED